jgi:hypothetical protein
VIDHTGGLGLAVTEDEVAIKVFVRCRTISSAWIRMSSD